MRMRTLILVLALMMVVAVVYAQADTSATATAGDTSAGASVTTDNSTTSSSATVTTDQGTTTCVPAPGASTSSATTGMSTTTTTTAALDPVEQFNRNFVSSYYNISPATVASLRDKGHPWEHIYFMANMAQKTRQPITQIAQLEEQGMSWNDIANRYNIALADLQNPFVPTTRVAGFTSEIGTPPVRTWMSDRYGNVVLTSRDDRMLKKMGYSWNDIAVASNIAAKTGNRPIEVLQWLDRGLTWPQIAREYGVNPSTVMDVSNYPFSRTGYYEPTEVFGSTPAGATSTTSTTTTTTTTTTPAGSGTGPTVDTTTPSMQTTPGAVPNY